MSVSTSLFAHNYIGGDTDCIFCQIRIPCTIGSMKRQLPELYGIGINEIADRCKVSIRTARRWKQGTMCPPESALMILRRDLGAFSEHWKGWTIRDKEITAPWGWTIARDHALTVPLMHGQISALRQELANLKKQLADAGADVGDWEVEILVGPPGRQRKLR